MKKKFLSRHFDRIIMGAIIGGAIGSVVGGLSKRKENPDGNPSGTQENPGSGSGDPWNSGNEENSKKKGILRRLLGL